MKTKKVIISLIILSLLSIIYVKVTKGINFQKEIEKAIISKQEVNANEENYKDATLKGADPVLSGKLIPVTIDKKGKVTYANTKKEWYNYQKKEWANAVILVDNPSLKYKVGSEIKESDIESYFVWIPRYRYKLWNANQADGVYDKSKITDDANSLTSYRMLFGNTRLIEIEFEDNKTPKSENKENGEWLTHPAFTLNGKELNGIWVGKFETGYNQGDSGKPIEDTTSWSPTKARVDKVESDKIIVKPNVYSWQNSTVSNFFKSAYEYERELDSHMMKNIEWGAVAYLSHSLYGIGKEVNINNNNQYKTGYSAVVGTDQSNYPGTSGNTEKETLPYNTPTGYLASTTGNITGVYDMSGGSSEYMAAYRNLGNNCAADANGILRGDCSGFASDELTKYAAYLDKYENSTMSSYSKRIFGDATGEMGPFYLYYDSSSQYHNSWYADYSDFIDIANPWFTRGGANYNGLLSGQFGFYRSSGTVSSGATRLVLAS